MAAIWMVVGFMGLAFFSNSIIVLVLWKKQSRLGSCSKCGGMYYDKDMRSKKGRVICFHCVEKEKQTEV